MCRLHLTSHRKCIVVGITRHTDHQVDVSSLEHGIGLFRRRHLGERWRIAHAEFHILIENLLIDTSVIFQHEGIVGIGHDQHIKDAPRHQIDERHILQIEFIPLLWYLGYFFHIVGKVTKKNLNYES